MRVFPGSAGSIPIALVPDRGLSILRAVKRWIGWGASSVLALTACQDSTATADETDDDTGTTTMTPVSTTGDDDDDETGESSADTTAGEDDTTDGSDDGFVCPPVDDITGGPTECEAGCEDHDFDLEHISMANYAGVQVHLLSPPCIGPTCPTPLTTGTYGTDPIVPCVETPQALGSPRGPEAFCRLAPWTINFGLELGFTEPPDPDSITEYRASVANPGEDEPYVWHDGIVELHGPTTAFNGRWDDPPGLDTPAIVSPRNLTCIANLEALGIAYDRDDLATACAATYDDDGTIRPLRMQTEGVIRPTRGRLESRSLSCDTPARGPDTCCSACDHELSVAVAKYGVAENGARLSPNDGNAIACDPNADRFEQCRDFRASVDRSNEVVRHRYEWDGCLTDWGLPLYDRIRETHPDDRPDDLEIVGDACADSGDCGEGHECIGTDAGGDACSGGGGCEDMRCRPEWFVTCRDNPESVLGGSYCIDRRFREEAAGACYQSISAFEGAGVDHPPGTRLAVCDADGDGDVSAMECCQDSLGNEDECDPFFQTAVTPVDRHDRNPMYPMLGQCVCEDGQPGTCDALIDAVCEPPIGAGTDPGGASSPGEYAHRTVSRVGGTRYSEELDGFELRFAHLGSLERGLTEACAESRALIDGPNPGEAWLAHDSFIPSLDANYDLAMCSGSTYELVFAGPDDPEHLASAAGDTLAGKQRYVIETSDLLVMPGSGFPTDNLIINACDSLSIRVTNKYDLSTDNLRKPSLWLVEDVGGEPVATTRVAGGRDCDPEATPAEVAMGAIPCLVVDVENAFIGELELRLDPDVFPDLLAVGQRYRVVLPGLDDPADIADPDAYVEAFHDACGMPLITGDLPEPEYVYEVTVDSACM